MHFQSSSNAKASVFPKLLSFVFTSLFRASSFWGLDFHPSCHFQDIRNHEEEGNLIWCGDKNSLILRVVTSSSTLKIHERRFPRHLGEKSARYVFMFSQANGKPREETKNIFFGQTWEELEVATFGPAQEWRSECVDNFSGAFLFPPSDSLADCELKRVHWTRRSSQVAQTFEQASGIQEFVEKVNTIVIHPSQSCLSEQFRPLFPHLKHTKNVQVAWEAKKVP